MIHLGIDLCKLFFHYRYGRKRTSLGEGKGFESTKRFSGIFGLLPYFEVSGGVGSHLELVLALGSFGRAGLSTPIGLFSTNENDSFSQD